MPAAKVNDNTAQKNRSDKFEKLSDLSQEIIGSESSHYGQNSIDRVICLSQIDKIFHADILYHACPMHKK